MMRKVILLTVLMSLVGIKITYSQEWQCGIEWEADALGYYRFLEKPTELSNGNLLVPTKYAFREDVQQQPVATSTPGATLLSDKGQILVQQNYFRPGYCTISLSHTFENNGNKYLLTTYSPEHTPDCFNHFENYDNPPSDGKLVLMKLDDNLNVEESYEHSWPVDTYEDHGGSWEIYPNGFSGNIYLFTAFKEDDNIVGAYWKSVSFDNPSRGDDTLFFFRMNFNGEILNRKAADVLHGKGSANDRGLRTNRYRGDHFVVTDSCYIFYRIGNASNGTNAAGCAVYYDKDFNLIKERYLVPESIPYFGDYDLLNITVKRSNHNTTYLSTQIRSHENPQHDEDVRLYEINDDVNSTLPYLEVVKYIDRGTYDWDFTSFLSSVDLIDDNSLCYVYELYNGYFNENDSWLVIEHLDNNLDTISTLYYGVGNNKLDQVDNIIKTRDGVIIVNCESEIEMAGNENYYCSYITKFPASAFGFDNIEEAHANNLHLAIAYPNPGGDVLNIRTGLRNATLQVYDMQGRIIHQQIITDEVTSIDASKWNSGTYIWNLKTENGKLKVEEGKWIK